MKKYLNNVIKTIVIIVTLFACNNTENVNSYMKKAILEIESKDYDNAFLLLNKAIELDSINSVAYFLRGQVKDLQNKNKDCVCEDYKKSLELGNIDAKKAYNVFCYKIPVTEFDKLIKEFNVYIKKYPNRFEGFYDRGNLKFDYGLLNEAIEDYNIAIKLQKYPVAYYNRGLCYLKLNNKEKAKVDILKAISLGYDKAKEALPFL